MSIGLGSAVELGELELDHHWGGDQLAVGHVEETNDLMDVGSHDDVELGCWLVADDLHAENQADFTQVLHLELVHQGGLGMCKETLVSGNHAVVHVDGDDGQEVAALVEHINTWVSIEWYEAT